MTIQSATRTATFAGNGSTTVFPLPSSLKFFAAADLQVYTYTKATGLLEQVLTLGTHYEVSGAGTDSASVTVYTAPASGKILPNTAVRQGAGSIGGADGSASLTINVNVAAPVVSPDAARWVADALERAVRTQGTTFLNRLGIATAR